MTTFFQKLAITVLLSCFTLAVNAEAASDIGFAVPPSGNAGEVAKPQAVSAKAEAPSLIQSKTEGDQKAEELKKEEPKKVVKKRRKKKRAPIVTLKNRDEVITFQRRHGIEPTGVVGKKTVRELKKVNANKVNSKDARKLREKVIDGRLDQNMPAAMPAKNRTKIIPSRFVKIEVEESGEGMFKRYTINFNGETLYYVNGQPSIIGVSKTFDMGDQEAVILTTYNPTNRTGCYYKNHILVLDPVGTKLLNIDNCTREYEAEMAGPSLLIEFREPGVNRAMPAMWRLDGLRLSQL